MNAAYKIFKYLKQSLKKDNGRIAFNGKVLTQILSRFRIHFYGETREDRPPKMLDPLWIIVRVSTYVDLNHAGNLRLESHIREYLFIYETGSQNLVQ